MSIFRKIWGRVYSRVTLRAQKGDIGIGLVGVGGWGMHNAVAVMRSGRYSIRAVTSVPNSQAQAFARRYKVDWHASLEELLARTDIEAVALTIPNPLHPYMVRASADAGKHIFVEKPLASDAEECQVLGEYCRQRNVILTVGHQVRRQPAFRQIKKILSSGQLGTPVYAKGIRAICRKVKDWRQDAQACPKGSMEQLGIHMVDAMIYLFGSPESCEGRCYNIPFQKSGAEWGQVTLHFPHNVTGTVVSSFSAPNRFAFSIHCQNGTLEYNGQLLRLESPEGICNLPISGVDGSVAQFLEFADCIKNNTQPETDAMAAQIAVAAISHMDPVDSRSK